MKPERPGRRGALIRLTGDIDADQAEQLWDAIEYAFETIPGRRVVVDLTEVTGYDPAGLQQLADCVRTAARRRDDLRLAIDPTSDFGRHLCADPILMFVATTGWDRGADRGPAQ